MWRWLFAACAAALLLGCPPPDPGKPDGSVDPDAGAQASCLERPTDAPAPPGSQLPCDLLPPGYGQ